MGNVVVHSMDRLARNLDDLRTLVPGLTRKGVRVEFVKESLVFAGEDSPMANLMLPVMGAFADFERSLMRKRQREGIALAKQPGGLQRKEKTVTPEQAQNSAWGLRPWHEEVLLRSYPPVPALSNDMAGRSPFAPQVDEMHYRLFSIGKSGAWLRVRRCCRLPGSLSRRSRRIHRP
jgi:Resolvase, N terminal domain